MLYKFSPSSLSLLKDCPRCFWLKFNKGIEMPGGVFPSLPSGMDSVIKKHFDSFREKGTVPEEIEETGASLFSDTEQLKIWRSNFKGVRWEDDKGNVLHGAVDDILEKDGKLIVIDFKTRGFPCKDDTHETYQDQLDIYNFLLRKNGHKTEDYAYLIFYHPVKVNGQGDVVFDRTLKKMDIDVKNAERIFRKAIEVLEGDEPASAEGCGVCGFVKKCQKTKE
jgi:hypothetical protein